VPSYGTIDGGITAPFKHFDLIFNGLNLANRKYDGYLYVSSGGYFGTPFGGYEPTTNRDCQKGTRSSGPGIT